MDPMFLPEVESSKGSGPRSELIQQFKGAGLPVPQILHLFAFKHESTLHLERFTQAVMRGPSPLPAGKRELIAAFTSRRNHCPF